MFKKMMQKWLGLPTADEGRRYAQAEMREVDAILREFGPSIVAYRIANGYVLRTCGVGRVPTLTYCKDHKGIADHIVTEAAKTALGVGQQYELPLTIANGGTKISTKAIS